MFIDYSPISDIVILGALILSFIADEILRATWNKMYFTIGVPIFIERVPVNFTHTNLPPIFLLAAEFQSGWIESFIFKELNQNIYGFRNKFFNLSWFRTSSLMHGLLIFDHEHKKVIVKGYARWSFIYVSLMTCIMIIGALFSNPLAALIIFAVYSLFVGPSYIFQSDRYSQVARFAAESWSRKYVPEQ